MTADTSYLKLFYIYQSILFSFADKHNGNHNNFGRGFRRRVRRRGAPHHHGRHAPVAQQAEGVQDPVRDAGALHEDRAGLAPGGSWRST